MAHGECEDFSNALASIEGWASGGVTLWRAILADPKTHSNQRRMAIEQLGRHGDANIDGPTIHQLLNSQVSDNQSAASQALGLLKYKPALPDLERVARDHRLDQNARYEAVDSYLALANRDAGDRLLVDLTDARHGNRVRGQVFVRLGQRKVLAARPILLEALADSATNHSADRGLRGLADRWEGVGFQPNSPIPQLWRDYWAKRDE